MLSDTDFNALHTRKKHTKGKSWCFGKKGWTKLNGSGEGGGLEENLIFSKDQEVWNPKRAELATAILGD